MIQKLITFYTPLLLTTTLLFQSVAISKVSAEESQLHEYRPPLTWLRSEESESEIHIGTRHSLDTWLGYQLVLDPRQEVFDNGAYTPDVNKEAVPEGVEWASWPQYLYDHERCYRNLHTFRRFQATFFLPEADQFDLATIKKMRVRSPYYNEKVVDHNTGVITNDIISQKEYVEHKWMRGNDIPTPDRRTLGINGSAPFANETDGWYFPSSIPEKQLALLKNGKNTLDFIGASSCTWGGFGKVEIVLEIDGEVPTDSVPPHPTPNPDNGQIAPFLRLPWKYEDQALSFNEAALSINSYFDHEYPLLSTYLDEPVLAATTLIPFSDKSRQTSLWYSSHDGYDYGTPAKVNYLEPQVAAADGVATYHQCPGCGHAIFIDHENGYQTRYYHLDPSGLVTNEFEVPVRVTQGDEIGKTGFTGNVFPKGPGGAHIHFMVVHDKNGNGDFEDNIPDGLVDPFGWQADGEDPWPEYTFDYNGQARTGSPSHYLWQEKTAQLDTELPVNGESINFEHYNIAFSGHSTEIVSLSLASRALTWLSATSRAVVPILEITARNAAGEIVTYLQDPYKMVIDLKEVDLELFDIDSLYIATSEDGNTWQKETTHLDREKLEISSEIDHFSYIALFGEYKDNDPPYVAAFVNNEEPKTSYESNAVVRFDTSEIKDLAFIAYKINDDEWESYEEEVTITEPGDYKVEWYAVDLVGNASDHNSIEFTIQEYAQPELTIFFDPLSHDYVFNANDTNVLTEVDSLITVANPNGSNNLEVRIKRDTRGRKNTLTIDSVRHNDETNMLFEPLTLQTSLFASRSGRIRLLNQKLFNGDSKQRLLYSASRKKTRFYSNKERSEYNGMQSLHIRIQDGLVETIVE